MTEISPGVWEYTLEISDGESIQYKYTRGNWETVEDWGTITGLANREATIDWGVDGTQLIDNTGSTGDDSDKPVQLWHDPLVVSHTPAAGETDVAVDTNITVTWSLEMETSPMTDFTVQRGSSTVAGVFTYDSGTDTVTFDPTVDLIAG